MLNKIISLGISKREAEELIKVSEDIDRDYNLLKEGYPIQYIIGYVNFCGNKILVNKNVLIPRYETELLVDKAVKYIKKIFDNPRILDIGTGSGAIAISIKKSINCIVDASDISAEAIKVAIENSKINHTNINFLVSDLLNNLNNKYDVIISNPPYIAYDEEVMDSVRTYEPNIALYAEENGLIIYRRIIEESTNYLKERFLIVFEIGCTQASRILEIAKTVYPNANAYVEKDFSDRDRYVFIINE